MTDLLLFVLFGLVLDHVDLFALAVFQNLGNDFCTVDRGRSGAETLVVGECDNAVKNDFVPLVCAELLNKENITPT